VPVPGTAGDITTWPGTNVKTIVVNNVAPLLLSGQNVLYLYDRDRNNGISGVMYSARITISPCDWLFYGDPCGSTVPNTWLTRAPAIGTSFEYRTAGDSLVAPQTTVNICVVGLSDTQTATGLPLPFDLGPLGAPGCAVLAAPDMLLVLVTDPAGGSSVLIHVPPLLDFLGLPLFFQTLVLDGRSNPLGLSATRGIAIDMRL
jgi:hypothetical protein